MTNVLDRIISLSNALSLDTTQGSKDLAELKGYVAGIEMIMDDFDNIVSEITPQTATGVSLNLFCNLFSISSSESEDDKRSGILKGYNQELLMYKYGELSKLIAKYNATCSAKNLKLNISADSFKECGLLDDLGAILTNYLPVGVEVVLDGTGLTWEDWESYLYMWEQLDRLKLSFKVLDKLK